MADFTPINTQEELNEVIGKRLEREAEKYKTQIQQLQAEADKVKDLNQKVDELNQKLTTSDAKIKQYETDSVKRKIANELGLPFEMADRLRGDDEKSIREDAEAIRKFVSAKPKGDPEFKPDSAGGKGNASHAAFRGMLDSLKGD